MAVRSADPDTSTTRQRVLDAAVRCVLERGFYRASSNEIARRAGVTWGVIQHHFGTREKLLLEVLEVGADEFEQTVADAVVVGDTAQERVESLLDILGSHYGKPSYLVYLQILLNMDHDPKTSVEVRDTMRRVSTRGYEHVQRLLGQALGERRSDRELAVTVFLALRGFALSQQLMDTLAYDTPPQSSKAVAQQRQTLAAIISAYLESE